MCSVTAVAASTAQGWDRASSCTPCGEGPWLSDRTVELLVGSEQPATVRGGSASCYIQAGMGVMRLPGLTEGADMVTKAVVCPPGLFGTSIIRYGTDASPCQPCPADMVTAGTANRAAFYLNADGDKVEITEGGYTSVEACASKPGWGYGDLGDGVSRPCDVGFFNAGGNMEPCKE